MPLSILSKNDIHTAVLSSALAENTRIAYAKGWQRFQDYCTENGIPPLSATPEQIADFLIHVAMQPSPRSGNLLSMGTVAIYKSAINKQYLEAEHPSPTTSPIVHATFKGLTRLRSTPCRRVKALREYHVREMLRVCDTVAQQPARRQIGLRDGALLALGFAGALRRSELCALTIGDIEAVPGAPRRKAYLYIRKSKTDQAGRGHRIALLDGDTVRPITRLYTWLDASGITQGPLFQTMRRGGTTRGKPLHPSDIPRLVKHYATCIGLDAREVSGHSLRAGFVTSAAVHHARLDKIMEITRHTNPSTVMKYIRDADMFSDHAGAGFL